MSIAIVVGILYLKAFAHLNKLKAPTPLCLRRCMTAATRRKKPKRKLPEYLLYLLRPSHMPLGRHFSIAVVSCQASSSPFVHFPTVIVHRLARFSLLSEVGAMAAT